MKTQLYTPKAIRGQKIQGYTKVSKAQVRKLFVTGQTFTGFLVGNKVSSFHFFGGWHLACKIKKQSWGEFEKSLNEFCFHLDAELGNQAAIYLKNA